MEITKWGPFREFTDLRREMDQLFNEFFGQRGRLAGKAKGPPLPGDYFPPIDVFAKGKEIIVRAGIPGVRKEEIKLSIEGKNLTIRGQIRRDTEIKDENYYRLEHHYGTFSRTVALPVDIDPEGMKAYYKDGVLEIVIPRGKTGIREIPVEGP